MQRAFISPPHGREQGSNYVKVGDQSLYQVGQQNEPPDDTGANDREKRAMQAAARAYMQIMKGG